ncbi:hypothetical protein ACWCYY_11965 [Kitasatospora sp. NPDC001664]
MALLNDQHCLKSLGPPDRPTVHPHTKLQLPAANPPLTWHLCALPKPWHWASNAHLAFEPAPDYHREGIALIPGLEVRMVGARPITEWGPRNIPANEPRRSLRRFSTCRNWQFAWWLRLPRAAPDVAVATPVRHGADQLPLL